MANLGLPMIPQEEVDFEKAALRDRVFERFPALNAEQRYNFDQGVGSVINKEGEILNASGGSGKTYTINLILTEVRSQGHIAVVTAVSEIAATLLEHKRTLHSRCSIPLRITEESMCHMKISDSPKKKLFQKARLLVTDVVTIGHKHVYECVDRSLRGVRQEPILPVVKRGSRAQIFHATLKQSYIWNHVQKIGEYKISISPPHLIDSARLQDLCEVAFRSIDEKYRVGLWMNSRAIITPINKAAEEVNKVVMSKLLQTDSKTYRSCITLHKHEIEFPLELINDLNPPGFPPHILILKKHSSIMLLRNLDPAEVANGTHAGIGIIIPLISLTTTEDYPFSFSRKQFPMKSAFRMTSNKSQGQTLEKVRIYLPTPMFSHGQFYVFNSRVGSGNNGNILALDSEYKGMKGIYTDNVVYKEIL
uniref:ATP-dependent DNA helicase n=1 Tax=Octopus bimaculoides TaxID=37653 RepID=A0A0L8G9W5_OCTBM